MENKSTANFNKTLPTYIYKIKHLSRALNAFHRNLGAADLTHWNYRKCLSYNHVGKGRPHCQTCSQTDLLSVRGSFSSFFSPKTNVMRGNHLTSEPRMSDGGGGLGNQPPLLSLLPISFALFSWISLSGRMLSLSMAGASHGNCPTTPPIQSGFRAHQCGLILAF